MSLPCGCWCRSQRTQSPSAGKFIQPAEGESLVICTAPELAVTIKVDSATLNAKPFTMGTATLVVGGSNFGTHDFDEITYFIGGRGRGVIEADTADLEPGTTMWVPKGVRHGFINTGGTPLQFVWVVSPRGLEESFRARGGSPRREVPPSIAGAARRRLRAYATVTVTLRSPARPCRRGSRSGGSGFYIIV